LRTGRILRLRTFGDSDSRRYYKAVDDGRSPAIRAFRLSVREGETVTVRFTPHLGCVRWITGASGSGDRRE
jgi:hypothetical protein